jgi:hypothetical protein
MFRPQYVNNKNIQMKKLLILVIMWAFTCPLSHLKAQDTLSYQSLASFEGDTVAYLEYNFNTRRKQYIGKKVSDIFKDLELPVIEVTETLIRFRMSEQGKPLGGEIIRISVTIIKTGKEPDPLNDYYISFAFKDPPLTPKGRWSPKLYEAIKDLEVSAMGTLSYKELNPRYIEYMKKKQKQ